MCAWNLAPGRLSPESHKLHGAGNKGIVQSFLGKAVLGHENSRLVQPLEVLTYLSSFK